MAADTCVAPVYELDEIVDDAQLKARQAFVDVSHPTRGIVRQVAPMIRFPDTPSVIEHVDPQPGAFTTDILASIGYEESEIRSLMEQGIVA